jgi:hypothetical protein
MTLGKMTKKRGKFMNCLLETGHRKGIRQNDKKERKVYKTF